VGKGELEVLDEELLDVRTADVSGLLDLHDLEDLESRLAMGIEQWNGGHTWIDRKRDR
jgi:hypothetical protein